MMPEYRYEWELQVAGHGSNREGAWENMMEGFVQAKVEVPEPVFRELIDKDYWPDEPEDTTPIKPNKLREFVELIARMKTEEDFGEEQPPFEDWICALNELIVSARKLTGIEGPNETEKDQ